MKKISLLCFFSIFTYADVISATLQMTNTITQNINKLYENENLHYKQENAINKERLLKDMNNVFLLEKRNNLILDNKYIKFKKEEK